MSKDKVFKDQIVPLLSQITTICDEYEIANLCVFTTESGTLHGTGSFEFNRYPSKLLQKLAGALVPMDATVQTVTFKVKDEDE